MRRKRPTKAEKRQDWDQSESRHWDSFFYSRLKAAKTIADLSLLHRDAVRETNPGRKFYSNLGFFLMTFTRPDGASGVEVAEYIRVIENDGAVPADKKKSVVRLLRG